ncbi:MAG: lipid A export permease/ATP-binding protein MsbA [Gammaproteobacteria bacterium GWE2_42_36]|nr:MAG: lipid A export permease/ATP-binding protein MsbA [Gammaproteobacteria bacterium GWE2_42_36]HCU04951.1 lipid A export permease/ATP-binding protein MsbA [Coxiellaceae bacterium]
MSEPAGFSKSFSLYGRLLKYVMQFWPTFLLAMMGNILYSGINSSLTYLLKPILNKGFIERDSHFVHFLPWLIFGSFVLQGLTNVLGTYCMTVVSRSVVMRFRQDIFSHLLKLPAKFFDNSSSGQLLSTIFYNVEQVANAGSDAVTDCVQSFCMIVGLLVVMFSQSWKLSLIFFMMVPLISLAVHHSSKRLRRINLWMQKQMGHVTSIAEEAIEGYRVIRMFGGQKYEVNKFNQATDQNRQAELKGAATKAINISGVQLLAGIALSVIIYVATARHMKLSAGSFVAIIAAMIALLKPLKTFTTVNTSIQRGLAGAQSVFQLLDTPVEEDKGTVSVPRVAGDITFDQVTFSYPNLDRSVLDQVSFRVKPGEVVALVGRSGGGKSTIISLLQRFYTGYSGRILIDDVSITDYQLANLRAQFAIVSQHVTLFNDTIARNISYGQSISEEAIIAAAKAAHAWEFIQRLPEGIHTLVGENGVLLSGGQRQRLAIARAILKNAPILLLDEATSSLDTESEKNIQVALEDLMRERTTLVVAHRLSTIENANFIIVLDRGKIVEVGDHKTLLSQDGYYAKLYKMQFRDE